jgi:hypothetical protein
MKLSLFNQFKKILSYFLVNNFNQQLISANDKTLKEVFHSQCGHFFLMTSLLINCLKYFRSTFPIHIKILLHK